MCCSLFSKAARCNLNLMIASGYAWRSEYEIGHAEIDEQHKNIFRLCRELNALVGQTGTEAHERFHQLIDETVRYVKTHFHCEQFYMEVNGYPELAEHTAEHQNILIGLAEELALIAHGQSGCPKAMATREPEPAAMRR